MDRYFLRILGGVGVFVFLPLFVMTFLEPHQIESSAREFIKSQVTKKVSEKLDKFDIGTEKETDPEKKDKGKLKSFLKDKAQKFLKSKEAQIRSINQQLKDRVPALIAERIAKLQNLDCTCRKKWEKSISDGLILKLQSLEQAKAKLNDFADVKYMEIVNKLIMDVRIFLGVNALAFILMLLTSFFKPGAIKHLLLPGILLFVSTLICSYFYLFEQNWFYTIIYNDYTGLGYLVYLGLVFGVLLDIALNKARITTEIINGFLNAIGSAASALSPC